jgi:hypothetical protein
LKNPLDGSIFAAGHHFGLEDNAKRPIADDFTLRVLYLFRFPCESILDFLSDDFCAIRRKRAKSQRSSLTAIATEGTAGSLPPMRKLENTPDRFCDITEESWRKNVEKIGGWDAIENMEGWTLIADGGRGRRGKV